MGRRKRGRKNPFKGDKFTVAAKEQGFKARSVFKLDEVQRRFPFLKQGMRVIDLGCFPGSWTQFVLRRVGKHGTVVGVDLKEPELPGTYLVRSVMEVTPEELLEALGGPADAVLSDMAQKTVGVPLTDHVRQMELVRRASDLAVATLAPGGSFLVKVFDGEEVPAWQDALRPHFGKLKRIRPEAVRRDSREFYVLGLDFKGRDPGA